MIYDYMHSEYAYSRINVYNENVSLMFSVLGINLSSRPVIFVVHVGFEHSAKRDVFLEFLLFILCLMLLTSLYPFV